MALRIFDKYTFYHIPKTGGMAVRRFLKKIDRNGKEIRAPHTVKGIKKAKANLKIHCCPLHIKDHDPDFSFCIVRHPLGWYESIYKSKVANDKSYFVNGWKPITTFESFVDQVLNINPDGYVTGLYARFAPFCGYVLHTENLEAELLNLFKSWGFSDLPRLEKKNVSKPAETALPKPLKEKLLAIEAGAINYLGYA